MRAELKGVSSVELPSYGELPSDPRDCAVLVTARIGPANADAADNFDFTVCTLAWIAHDLSEAPFLFGKNLLIVDEFSWETVESALQRLCASTFGDNWEAISAKIAMFGDWEFTDYKT